MPMDKTRYPANWTEIALEIKQAAQWRCKSCGKDCLRPDDNLGTFIERIRTQRVSECPVVAEFLEHPRRWLLTVAHLDQDPGNNDRRNLKALCSVCHLNHDRPFQAANHMTKLERTIGQLNLFDLRPPEPAGKGERSDRIQIPLRQEVG